ncbi:MAG: beta-N-acetylglucosaminidase domain-containing protein [Chloroflexi bacterium]|nr:beta-N-acetylglucosaminidase domain-containing protein [Chloroflexota bacterium]
MKSSSDPFICGVVEGFYGRPWNARQRHQLFGWMGEWGLNAYLYAPKDDLKHRVRWRDLYAEAEAAELAALIRDCQRHSLSFIYALAPGLDMRSSAAADTAALQVKTRQLLSLGCRDFALLFDDIPAPAPEEGAPPTRLFAQAQCALANDLFSFIQGQSSPTRSLFCPTVYCGRMAAPTVKESVYLQTIGAELNPVIDVLWTGPEIISESISIASIRELQSVIRRRPLLWDNLQANDYDMRRLYLGPYAGRPLELRGEISGVLTNPNCQFEANFIPIRTLGLYAREQERWEPRRAYLESLQAWLPAFAGDSAHGAQVSNLRGGNPARPPAFGGDSAGPVVFDDLELLGDVFYLPHEFGARAEAFLEDVRSLLADERGEASAALARFDETSRRLGLLFDKMIQIQNRELLYAFYHYLWELKEEAALLRAYVHWLRSKPAPGADFFSPEHRPKIYRGGFAAELQRLLPMDEQGRFHHD